MIVPLKQIPVIRRKGSAWTFHWDNTQSVLVAQLHYRKRSKGRHALVFHAGEFEVGCPVYKYCEAGRNIILYTVEDAAEFFLGE